MRTEEETQKGKKRREERLISRMYSSGAGSVLDDCVALEGLCRWLRLVRLVEVSIFLLQI